MNDSSSSSFNSNELNRILLENEIKSLNYELEAVKKTKDNNIIYQKKSNVFFLQPSRTILVSDIQTKINEKNKDLDSTKSTINKKKSTNNNTNNKTMTTTTTTTTTNSSNNINNTKTNNKSKFKPNIKK